MRSPTIPTILLNGSSAPTRKPSRQLKQYARTTDAPIFIEPQPVVQPLAIEVIYPEQEAVALRMAAARSSILRSSLPESEREPERSIQIRLVPLPSPDVVRPAIVKPVGKQMNDRSAAEILVLPRRPG